jgi:hypothetical protein
MPQSLQLMPLGVGRRCSLGMVSWAGEEIQGHDVALGLIHHGYVLDG